MKILVTGGAGFIGSAIVRQLIQKHEFQVVNIDNLTYAADPARLASVADSNLYTFEKADICNAEELTRIFAQHQPTAVIHAAAETHVDRSIDSSSSFIQTNIVGTHVLLETTRAYLTTLPESKQATFRYLQVSTDEVYGDRHGKSPATETTAYQPSSPYAASKASADHLVDAWVRTYHLPALITHSSNNYGPGQNKEKLIPRMLTLAARDEKLPVFGSGKQIRDWLYVEDNANATIQVLLNGELGEHYNISADCAKTNLEVIQYLCGLLDASSSPKGTQQSSHSDLIEHIADRPGHDFQYALDAKKIRTLGWTPQVNFEQGLAQTVEQHCKSTL